jgi:hypothetical protein
VRSYEVEQVNALWPLDIHHGSRKVLSTDGDWVKPMLLGGIDDRSRLVCHLQWYLDKTAASRGSRFMPGLQCAQCWKTARRRAPCHSIAMTFSMSARNQRLLTS